MTGEQFQEFTLLLEGMRRPIFVYFIPALATIIAIAAASYFAWRQISNQRDIARKRTTIDLIIKYETDEYYQRCVQSYRLFRNGDLTVSDIVSQKDSSREHSERFNSFLNYHEIMALGIARGIVDKGLFRDWWGHTCVSVWNRSAPVIGSFRAERDNDKIMEQFEALARDYARDLDLPFTDLNVEPTDNKTG